MIYYFNSCFVENIVLYIQLFDHDYLNNFFCDILLFDHDFLHFKTFVCIVIGLDCLSNNFFFYLDFHYFIVFVFVLHMIYNVVVTHLSYFSFYENYSSMI